MTFSTCVLARRTPLCVRVLLLASAVSATLIQAQVNSLTFRPLDAKYDDALERIIMVSATPNQLHIYNPASGSDATVALSGAPLSVGLSPDGSHAAVATSSSILYINLQTQAAEQTFTVQVGNAATVVLTPTSVFVFPASSYSGSMVGIDLQTGAANSQQYFYLSGANYNAALNAIYGTQNGYSPNDLQRYSVSTPGMLTTGTGSPYHGDFSVCGNVWFSADWQTLYTGCGTAFHASSDTTKDMRYASSFPGLSNIRSLYASNGNSGIAAIPATPQWVIPGIPAPPGDSEVFLFDSVYLNPTGHFQLAPFTVGGNTYTAHGTWIFYNHAATSIYVLAEADSSSGLLNDFDLQSFSPAPSSSCSVVLGASQAAAVAAGSYAQIGITSSSACTYAAASNANWITVSSNSVGSGNDTIKYLVRPNLTAQSRTGTVTIGNSSLTVTQAAAPASSSFIPLSFKAIAAEYDNAKDLMVIVSADPNEIHLFNPITQADTAIALSLAPLSVSVSPDGSYAAVGHDGYVSYIDLNTSTVNGIYPIETDVHRVVLAGNGYLYAFPSRDWSDIYSLQISSGTWTAVSAIYDGREPRLDLALNSLYVGGSWTSKWDISNGPATLVSNYYSNASTCGNLWLSQDGARIFTKCGTVYRASPATTQDFTPNGSLSAAGPVQWAAESQAQGKTAVLEAVDTSTSATPSVLQAQLQMYDDATLTLIGQEGMPGFSVGSTQYNSSGRFLAWNAGSTKLYALLQADPASGLLSDYAVYVINAPGSLPGCTYSVDPATFTFGPAYASGSVQVTSNCDWKATVASNSFVYLSGAIGTGNGAVGFWVNSNTGAQRSTTINIGNKSVTINQADSSCAYVLNPTQESVYAGGADYNLQLTTGSGCGWTVLSNNPWITVSSPSSGTGPATITYSVAANTSGGYRSGSITVGGITFSISQSVNPAPVALRFVPVTPCRVIDTRGVADTFGGPALIAQEVRSFPLPSGACNLPSNAQAYSLNVTAVPSGKLGYLSVWPTGAAQPNVSTLNSYDGRVKATAAIVPAGSNGAIGFYATDRTNLVVDVNGYFVPATDPSALSFYPVTPCRVADTRGPTGSDSGPLLMAGETRDFTIAGKCNIPANASAYVLNMTVVPRDKLLAYLTTWPTGTAQPIASTLNSYTGVVTANAAIVPAGNGGAISTYVTHDTDLVIDVAGYFGPAGSPGGLSFYSVQPCRNFDTRSVYSWDQTHGLTSHDVPLTGSIVLPPFSVCGVPNSAQAYVVNATVIPSTELRYLTVWPTEAGQPGVSTLNSYDGAVTSNMAIVPSSTASISAFATDTTELIIDLSGYFAP